MKLGARQPGAEDTQTVARTRGALEGYLASHGPDVHVSARHILDLLNPHGKWSLEPQHQQPVTQPAAAPAGEPGPGRDPLTGCRPASPPAG